MKVEVAKYRKPDGYATRYWSVIVDGEAGAGKRVGHHVGDAGFADTGWAVEQDFYRDGGITVELACLGDESAGDNGGGAAEVIGSGRSPRQRRACGARCRVRQNLEEL